MDQSARPDDSRQPDEQDVPNRASNPEEAEGSRDRADDSEPLPSGITNRPLEQEREEQQNLPPRGERQDGSHA